MRSKSDIFVYEPKRKEYILFSLVRPIMGATIALMVIGVGGYREIACSIGNYFKMRVMF